MDNVRMHIYTAVVMAWLGVDRSEWAAICQSDACGPNGSHIMVRDLGIFTAITITGYTPERFAADCESLLKAQDAYVSSAGL